MQCGALIQMHIENLYTMTPRSLQNLWFSLYMCAHLSASVSEYISSPAVVHQDSV